MEETKRYRILSDFPDEVNRFIHDSNIEDCSGYSGQKTYYIQKRKGFYLKIGEKNSLSEERIMTEYFQSLGLSEGVERYITADKDYLITRRLKGQSGIDELCLASPEKLCVSLAQALKYLHSIDYSYSPIKDRTGQFVADMAANTEKRVFDDEPNNLDFLAKLGFEDNITAYDYFMNNAHLLDNNALIHGDSCLPNVFFNDFQLRGFIDLGLAGVGDRHYDLFWSMWTLFHNLHTRKYEAAFMDSYGSDNIDLDKVRLWAIHSAFNN